MTLHKDIFQTIYLYLETDDKYVFHKFSDKYYKENISFTSKIIDYINTFTREDWCKLCYKLKSVNIYFCEDFSNYIKWDILAHFKKLDEEFVIRFLNYLDKKALSHNMIFSEKFMAEYKDILCWANLSLTQNMSLKFIKAHEDYIIFKNLSWNSKIKLDVIRYYKDILDWDGIISTYIYIDNIFHNEFSDYISSDNYKTT